MNFGCRTGLHRICVCYVAPSKSLNPDFTISTNTVSAMPNARVLRDIKARQGVYANEIARRAYLYVARNETLPPQVRHQAQLQLNTYGRYTRPTTVKNRCIVSGKGRGIISEFGLSRVCRYAYFLGFTLLISSTVPIPYASSPRRTQWCAEGLLVNF